MPSAGAHRLSSVSSHDSGFVSQDANTHSKPPSPMPSDITSQVVVFVAILKIVLFLYLNNTKKQGFVLQQNLNQSSLAFPRDSSGSNAAGQEGRATASLSGQSRTVLLKKYLPFYRIPLFLPFVAQLNILDQQTNLNIKLK